jgi:hypothetical protein
MIRHDKAAEDSDMEKHGQGHKHTAPGHRFKVHGPGQWHMDMDKTVTWHGQGHTPGQRLEHRHGDGQGHGHGHGQGHGRGQGQET